MNNDTGPQQTQLLSREKNKLISIHVKLVFTAQQHEVVRTKIDWLKGQDNVS